MPTMTNTSTEIIVVHSDRQLQELLNVLTLKTKAHSKASQ